MRMTTLAAVALIAVAGACAHKSSRADPTRPLAGSTSSKSVVGRWVLLSLVRNGEDLTDRVRRASASTYYTFNVDGTFRIMRGDSVAETGRWSQDTTSSPMTFDHIPDVDGNPGPYVPGIFAVSGDTLTVSLKGPNPQHRHPTQFRSILADSSWLLVYRRAPQ